MHILKSHPGALLPSGQRSSTSSNEIKVPSYSQLSGSVTAYASRCDYCPKQYASRAKLMAHQRKDHADVILRMQQEQALQAQLQMQQQV